MHTELIVYFAIGFIHTGCKTSVIIIMFIQNNTRTAPLFIKTHLNLVNTVHIQGKTSSVLHSLAVQEEIVQVVILAEVKDKTKCKQTQK